MEIDHISFVKNKIKMRFSIFLKISCTFFSHLFAYINMCIQEREREKDSHYYRTFLVCSSWVFFLFFSKSISPIYARNKLRLTHATTTRVTNRLRIIAEDISELTHFTRGYAGSCLGKGRHFPTAFPGENVPSERAGTLTRDYFT